MAFSDLITQWIYTEQFLTSLGAMIILLSLLLLVIIFIELRVKKTVKVKLNEKGVAYLKRIDKIRKTQKKSQQSIKEVNIIIKEFLKDYLKLTYTPTYGETLEMIQEKKQMEDIRQLCNEASAILYAGEKPTDEKVEKIIEMFENIVKYRLIKLDEEKAKEIEKILGKVKEEFIDERKIRLVMSTIKSGRQDLIKNNLSRAYKNYAIVNAFYKNLNQKEKEVCKSKILEFYKEITQKNQAPKQKTSIKSPPADAMVSLATEYSPEPTEQLSEPESQSRDTQKE